MASRQPRAQGYSHVVLTKHAYVTGTGARRPQSASSPARPRNAPPCRSPRQGGGLHGGRGRGVQRADVPGNRGPGGQLDPAAPRDCAYQVATPPHPRTSCRRQHPGRRLSDPRLGLSRRIKCTQCDGRRVTIRAVEPGERSGPSGASVGFDLVRRNSSANCRPDPRPNR